MASSDTKYGDKYSTTNNRRNDNFPKEQINHENRPEVNETFQVQIDAIRSVDNIEKVESIINEKKAPLKNGKDVHESDRFLQSWMA